MKTYKQFLKERSMQQIQAFRDFSDYVNDYDPDRIYDLFDFLYELEFKYNMIKNYPFSGLEQRKNNILKLLEDKINKSITPIVQMFEKVYINWIGYHAPRNFEEWYYTLDDAFDFSKVKGRREFLKRHSHIFPTLDIMNDKLEFQKSII